MMDKADFLTALIFFVIGVFMVASGTTMPGPAEVSYIEPGGEPGRVPILLGAIIAAFSLILLVRSIARGGHRLSGIGDFDEDQRMGLKRSMVAAVGCSIYAVGLVGLSIGGFKMPYEVATGLFLFLFICGFEWAQADELGAKRWQSLRNTRPGLAGSLSKTFAFIPRHRAPYVWLMVSASVQAVLVSAIVTYLFEKEFYVTLP